MTGESTQRWQFTPLDTWFFRESRPMESVGGGELQSIFPPSIQTVSGAVRTAIGNSRHVDWSRWKVDSESYPDLRELIGDSDSLGRLSFSGPWITQCAGECGPAERLYVLPKNVLVCRAPNDDKKTFRLQPGRPRYCDLGRQVRIPVLKESEGKPLSSEKFWLNGENLRKILEGKTVGFDNLIEGRSLFVDEPRLGIARDNATRSNDAGMLYQTRHVRILPGIAVEVDVDGVEGEFGGYSKILRLGAEGRGACVSVEPVEKHSELCFSRESVTDAFGIVLILLTPLRMGGGRARNLVGQDKFLPGFVKVEQEDSTVWKGELNSMPMTLHSIAAGKAIREGGWDLKNNRPKPMDSYWPAGTVFYLTPDGHDINLVLKKLHLSQISGSYEDTSLGRGLVAAGIWPVSEFINQGESQ